MTRADRYAWLRAIAEIRRIRSEAARGATKAAAARASEARLRCAENAEEIDRRASDWAAATEIGPNLALHHHSWRKTFQTLAEEGARLENSRMSAVAQYEAACRSWYEAEAAKESAESVADDAGREVRRKQEEALLAESEDRVAARWRSG